MLWQTIAQGVHVVHMPVLETELRLQLCGHDGLGFLRCLSLAGRPVASSWDAAREAGSVSCKYTEKRGWTFTIQCLIEGCFLLPHSVPCSNLGCAHPTCLNPAWEISVGDPGCCNAAQLQCSVVAQRKAYMGALCARAGLCFLWGDMILLVRDSLCDVHVAVVWHAEDTCRMMHSCCLLTCFGSKATRRRGPCRTLLVSWL